MGVPKVSFFNWLFATDAVQSKSVKDRDVINGLSSEELTQLITDKFKLTMDEMWQESVSPETMQAHQCALIPFITPDTVNRLVQFDKKSIPQKIGTVVDKLYIAVTQRLTEIRGQIDQLSREEGEQLEGVRAALFDKQSALFDLRGHIREMEKLAAEQSDEEEDSVPPRSPSDSSISSGSTISFESDSPTNQKPTLRDAD